jgi:hypothetical protein
MVVEEDVSLQAKSFTEDMPNQQSSKRVVHNVSGIPYSQAASKVSMTSHRHTYFS